MENEKRGELVEVTGLWKTKTGDGLVGYMGDARVLIFKNTFKKEEKHPDYKLFVTRKSEKSETDKETTL